MRAARLALGALVAALLCASAAAPAQPPKQQDMTWPAGLSAPAGESWITDQSTGAAKNWFRRVAERLDAVPFVPIDWQFTGADRATIAKATIAADGRLESVDLLRSSGSTVLDTLVLEGVRRAAPYPPPTDEILAGGSHAEVVALFGAETRRMYSPQASLTARPAVAVDLAQRLAAAREWQDFMRRIDAAVGQDLESHLTSRAPTTITLDFTVADAGLRSVTLGAPGADPRADAQALARAQALVQGFKAPPDPQGVSRWRAVFSIQGAAP